jgi:hypothetical protein
MKIKNILTTCCVLAVASGFAVAGVVNAEASGRKPAEVTVYKNFNNAIDAPAEDKVIPGPDPVEGVAEGVYFTGLGVFEGGREVVDGIGESGGKVADDAVAYGPPGLVSGTVKGAARIGEGAVRGAGTIGYGAIKGAGCIVTFGATC